jgi:hypothetical protein
MPQAASPPIGTPVFAPFAADGALAAGNAKGRLAVPGLLAGLADASCPGLTGQLDPIARDDPVLVDVDLSCIVDDLEDVDRVHVA